MPLNSLVQKLRPKKIKEACGKCAIKLDYYQIFSHTGFRMTKSAQWVISIFIIGFFLTFLSGNIVQAEYLVQPLPQNDPANISASYDNLNINVPVKQLLIVSTNNANKPSISFGDLLSNQFSTESGTVLSAQDNNYILQSTQSAGIKNLLSQLEASYYASQKELADFNKNRPGSLYGTPTPTPNPSYIPASTPYIPLPTLKAALNEIANNLGLAQGDQLLGSDSPQTYIPLSANTILPTNTPTPIPTIIATPSPIKTNYTVALLGDSMTDTLGRNLPQLHNLLTATYPNYSFALLNYGQGSTDLESGLNRLTNYSTYLGTTYPPLLSFKPDILVIESFAYNHWSPTQSDLDRQWLGYAKIADTVRQNSPSTKIIFAASISPNIDTFGDGTLNWPKNLKWNAAMTIKAYLQNMINFATSQHYPLADAYHTSMDTNGNGQEVYINQGDHIHPSSDGGLLYSKKIVETIQTNNLLP
ncbi:SGNH/GDSL hydrolase family protein [Patescibacteria group bacterium]|nr:SGNH/GDSL hydrolase family protein [Patescibacteria group bacterium]